MQFANRCECREAQTANYILWERLQMDKYRNHVLANYKGDTNRNKVIMQSAEGRKAWVKFSNSWTEIKNGNSLNFVLVNFYISEQIYERLRKYFINLYF